MKHTSCPKRFDTLPVLWSERPCRVLPAWDVSLAGARDPHPSARRADDVAERVVDVLGTATVAHSDFANNEGKELDRGGDSFKSKKHCSWNAHSRRSRNTHNTHATSVFRLILNILGEQLSGGLRARWHVSLGNSVFRCMKDGGNTMWIVWFRSSLNLPTPLQKEWSNSQFTDRSATRTHLCASRNWKLYHWAKISVKFFLLNLAVNIKMLSYSETVDVSELL